MGRVRKVKKRYNYNKNRRRQWKQAEKKAAVGCAQLKEVWDEKKTLSKNLQEMGLALNPNKLLAVPSTKDSLGPKRDKNTQVTAEDKPVPPKSFVIAELENEANRPPQDSHTKLSEPEVLFCTYMLDKYGDDYKAMARDYRNYYQDTPKQIKRRIDAFRNSPEQYNAYLESKKAVSQQNNINT